MIYANNQVGFSLMEYLIVKTDGSSKEKNCFYKELLLPERRLMRLSTC
jgi:hypothetical protein